MALNNAILFIRNITGDADFRKTCFSCKNKKELHALLDASDMSFTPDEFSAAFDMVHVKCQTTDEVDLIKQAEAIYYLFPAG
jgi:hypothetical protein